MIELLILGQGDPVTAGNALSSWVTDQGLAIVLVFVFLFLAVVGTWKGGRYLGVNILEPLKDAGIQHLQKLGAHMDVHDENMRGIQSNMHEMNIAQAATNARLAKHEEHHTLVEAALREMNSKRGQL